MPHADFTTEYAYLAATARGLGFVPSYAAFAKAFPLAVDFEKADLVSAFFCAVDWDALYHMAVEQGTCAITWTGIKQLLITSELDVNTLPSKDFLQKWYDAIDSRHQRYQQQYEAVRFLAEFYAGRGVGMMLLNGFGLSLDYPVPEEREAGDVDIWLYGDQAVADELLHNGRNIAIEREPSGQSLFRVDHILVENHHALPEADVVGGEERGIDVAGTRVALPAVDVALVYMIRHSAAKFRRKWIKMRHVTDFAVFVRKHQAEIDWTTVRSASAEFGCVRYLDALVAFSRRVLGVDAGFLPEDRLSDRDFRDFTREVIRPRFPFKLQKDAPLAVRWSFALCRWKTNRWKRRFVDWKKCYEQL